jgi:3-isopropylmalate/(R)-2-methylmalate dehydratase small subunit
LIVVQCPSVYDHVQKGDIIEIEFDNGKVINKDREFSFPPIPEEILSITKEGGLIPYIKKKLSSRKRS